MGYVEEISLADYKETKDVFIADVATEVLFRDIPKDPGTKLGSHFYLQETGPWKSVVKSCFLLPMQMIKGKSLLSYVAANATGEYLPPQLIYKGKTTRCHPHAKFPEGWDIWHTENRWSNEETMKRYIQKIVVSFISRKRSRFSRYTSSVGTI